MITSDTKSVGAGQKSPSSKAAAIFARGAYWYYLSTEKWRERRWWLFSTPYQGEKNDTPRLNNHAFNPMLRLPIPEFEMW